MPIPNHKQYRRVFTLTRGGNDEWISIEYFFYRFILFRTFQRHRTCAYTANIDCAALTAVPDSAALETRWSHGHMVENRLR